MILAPALILIQNVGIIMICNFNNWTQVPAFDSLQGAGELYLILMPCMSSSVSSGTNFLSIHRFNNQGLLEQCGEINSQEPLCPASPKSDCQVARATRRPPFQLKSRLGHRSASPPMYRAVPWFDDDVEGNSTLNKRYTFQASGTTVNFNGYIRHSTTTYFIMV